MRKVVLSEYQLMILPVTVGEGEHLFRNGSEGPDLELIDTKTTSTGVARPTYRLAREPAHGDDHGSSAGG
jgi:hypothetical protein